MAAVRPMLATTSGRFVGLSTPFGKRGWFWDAWDQGEGWERIRITADQCPRIDPDWLADERRVIGDFAYRQEYECEFLDDGHSLFSSDIIAKAFSPEVAPLWS